MSKKIITLFLFLLFASGSLLAQQPASPKHEVRAVWLTTIGGLDWPHGYAQSSTSAERQKRQLCQLLDKYQKAGINTVLLQTRIRGTVIYPSALEPWDGCLSGFPGKSPSYDALAFAIDECHRRGMELQAWVVTIPVGKWNKLGCKSLVKKMPGLIKRIDDEGYMNPADERTAPYLAALCKEIVSHYDVDGIHLDYIRYPENWKGKVNAAQGRDHITRIVRAVHDAVKAVKPWVKMSCSPIGKYDDLSRYWSHGWNAYTKGCQDAQGWLRDGLMDELFPMMYFRDDQFFPFAIDWAEQSHGKIVAPGLGIYFLNPSLGRWHLDDVEREMQVLRAYGLGHAYFRGKFLTDNTQGIYDFAETFCPYPALVPPMTWVQRKAPAAPTHCTTTADGLSWQGSAPYYNVYSSRTWPVNIADAANLVSMRQRSTRLIVPTQGRYFAITAMDRYGNESEPLQNSLRQSKSSPVTLLPVVDNHVQLPQEAVRLGVRVVVVRNLMGQVVESRAVSSRGLSVTHLAPGHYELRSLNDKGISHRLGFFEIPIP